jgi:hypothetical protein
MRPPRQWAIVAVRAEAALTATLAPAPADAEEENWRTTGRRRFPRTSPATPPATATAKDQTATEASSSGDTRVPSLWIGAGVASVKRPRAARRPRLRAVVESPLIPLFSSGRRPPVQASGRCVGSPWL